MPLVWSLNGINCEGRQMFGARQLSLPYMCVYISVYVYNIHCIYISVYVRSFTLCNCSKGSFQREFLYSTAANIPQFMTQKPILPAAPLGKYNFQMRILHTSSKLLNTITQLNMDVQQDLWVLFKALYSFVRNIICSPPALRQFLGCFGP